MILDIQSVCNLIDPELSELIHKIIMLIKIATPIVLVVFGMLDLAKGVIASKEDEIKKGQHVFIQRLIAGAIVFFVVTIVQLVIGLVSTGDSEIWNCANAIMNGQKYKAPSNDNYYHEYEEEIDDCCKQAGGSLNKNNVCEGATSAAYNACINSKKENTTSDANNANNTNTSNNIIQVINKNEKDCCKQAGGSLNNNNECEGAISAAYNACINSKKETDIEYCCKINNGEYQNNSCQGAINANAYNACLKEREKNN